MYVEMNQTLPGGSLFEAHLKTVALKEAERMDGDQIAFSKEAIAAFKEATIEPIKNGTFTLESIERRIGVVEAEIVQVWNSPLPDEEKYKQISAKKNEIALLQAGQFTFAKAGFAKTA